MIDFKQILGYIIVPIILCAAYFMDYIGCSRFLVVIFFILFMGAYSLITVHGLRDRVAKYADEWKNTDKDKDKDKEDKNT